MLSGFMQLLAFLLAGEVIAYVFALPLPGAPLGMGLLFLWLCWRGKPVAASLQQAGSGVLQYLSLLFVPAGVGIVLHLHRLQAEGAAIAGSVLGGTLLAIAGTGLLMQRLGKGAAHHD